MTMGHKTAVRRETGAWAMLGTAVLAGLAAGGWGRPGLLAALATGAALWAVQAPGARRWLLVTAAVLAGVAALLVTRRLGLLLPGGIGAVLLALRLCLRRGSWGEQLAGIGLTATAAAGVAYAAGGTVTATVVVAGLVAAHQTGGILRVRRATGRAEVAPFWPEAAGLVAAFLLAVGGGLAPPFSFLAFLPGLWRSLGLPAVRPHGREEFRRLGRAETAVSVAFLVLFILAVWVGRPMSWRG